MQVWILFCKMICIWIDAQSSKAVLNPDLKWLTDKFVAFTGLVYIYVLMCRNLDSDKWNN